MTAKPIVWSYSAAKDFENCPRKYYELRVAKNYKQEETEATRYGTEVHKSFEDFVRDGTPLPPQFERFQRFVAPLLNLRGDRYCEYKIGVTASFKPCEFFGADVWWRGIPDLLVVNEDAGVARVVDYKTGKSSRYADTDQLELLAAAIMSHFPKVNLVKGALLFVVADALVKAEYRREQLPQIWSKWTGKISRIETAQAVNVWHEKQGPLCGWCPVTACIHHKPRK